MIADEPTEDDLTRRRVDRSAALRAGTLDADCRGLLGHGHPQWQREAANLIADGVAARLGVHTIDFLDYRGDLAPTARLTRH